MSGIGNRFINAGYTIPKPLIIIENKPIIQHIIELFPNETNFIFICNDKHLKETNMKNILKNIAPKCKIYEVPVTNRKGPVDAVMQIANKEINNDDEIIISYCDYGTYWDYENFKLFINKYNLDGAIPSYIGFHPHMLNNDNYAFIKTDNNNNLIKIQEKKPFTNNKMMEYASNGTYYFKNGYIMKKYFNKLIDLNISINNEFYVSMVYNLMKDDGLLIKVYEIEYMLQWGTPNDLEEYLFWSNYFIYRNIFFNKSFIDNNNTTLILPMAGEGSRFKNDGYDIPKPLLPIENKPMYVKAVECLPPSNNIIFICQEKHYDIINNIKNYFNNSNIITINYITDGQACTCELAFNNYNILPDNPIMISACDNGVYYDIYNYINILNDNNVDIIIWSFSNNNTSKLYPYMYAWLDVDDNNFIKRVSVKKPFNDINNKYAIIGTMLFKKSKYFKQGLDYIYKHNIKTNNEYYVDNMIEPLVNMGYKCKIFNVDYLCWGTPNDYKIYNYWYNYYKKKYCII